MSRSPIARALRTVLSRLLLIAGGLLVALLLVEALLALVLIPNRFTLNQQLAD